METLKIRPLRWYILAEVRAIDTKTSAVLLTREVRADRGCFGSTLTRRIRARGESVVES